MKPLDCFLTKTWEKMARFSLLLLHLLTVLVPFAKAQTGRTSVTYTSPHRFLFDINGNQVDAYAASIECMSVALLEGMY